jgi:hypothetical protein
MRQSTRSSRQLMQARLSVPILMDFTREDQGNGGRSNLSEPGR